MEWKQSLNSWKSETSWGADTPFIGALIYIPHIADLGQDLFFWLAHDTSWNWLISAVLVHAWTTKDKGTKNQGTSKAILLVERQKVKKGTKIKQI